MGATGPKCNFFFKFATRSLAGGAREKGGLSPPLGRPGGPPIGATGGLSPPHRATGPSPPI